MHCNVKTQGYPWWPAVVLPESEEGEWKRGGGSSFRCVFLQDNQSFGWERCLMSCK